MPATHPLLETLLLGTDRRPVLPIHLPQSVRTRSEAAFAEPAARLLHASALWTIYQRAGQMPTDLVNICKPAPPETSENYCPPAYADLWLQIVAANERYPVLEWLWVQGCVAQAWLIPPFLLVSILEKATQHRTLRVPVLSILGERGRWLMAFEPKWHWAAQPHKKAVVKKTEQAETASTAALHALTQRSTDIARLAKTLAFEWSLPLSAQLLRCLADSWNGYRFDLAKTLSPLWVFLHPEAQPQETCQLGADLPDLVQRWHAHVCPHLTRLLDTKRALLEVGMLGS